MLFFGVIKRIIDNHTIEKLYVEVEDESWMQHRMQQNASFCFENPTYYTGKIYFVENAPQKHKRRYYLKIALGKSYYTSLYKFLGGGEVLTDERKSPHDGWNLLLLFGKNMRKKTFTLLGGIAPPKKVKTHFLYRLLLPRARAIIVRDQISYDIGHKHNPQTELYQDFALSIIRKGDKECSADKVLENKNPYLLINLNQKELTEANIQAILSFCQQYPMHEKYFLPCDQKDDTKCYSQLKAHMPDLLHYDWTQHRLEATLAMYKHADAGIGCRLHFLLPLMTYNKPLQAIPYAQKITAMIH